MSESAGLNSLIHENGKLVVSTAKFPVISTDEFDLHGPFVGSGWVDGGNAWVIEYSLEGERQKCGLSPMVYRADGWNLTLTPSSTPDWTFSGNGTTECVILAK